MSTYKKILVAIDINADYEGIITKALSICQSPKDLTLVYISLSAIYIQPYLYGADYNAIDDAGRLENARNKLADIGKEFGIIEQQVCLKTGNAADEIKDIANDIEADLIVIGTHGRSGIKLLLGSTANAVLHGVKQDVLAVRLHEHK
ncbi:universal stress protein A homolog 2 [Glaciecola punicea ACAM 611]|jgi:universal stress protein A|uniref:Universal stress protein n=1 Tax=Glaciecola punicea ACAM 611 TaxID=1121923 RepID=H5T8B1_9ALTE|nr:universal stress protein [Glaciecola punicea]OFA30561.1 universal stress protein UspA [Glaciecola punicea]GAB54552.1 universal stress protein A homolog 2 [Glaciecola punicea ACAM 611]